MSSETDKIDELIIKAREYNAVNKLNIYEPIYRQSTSINYKKGIANSAYGIAVSYDRSDSPDKSIEYCSIAYPIFKELNDKSGEAKCYNIIAKAYSALGDSPMQAEYLFKGLELSIASKDLHLQHKFYNNISNYYIHFLNDYDKGLEYMNASVEIAQRMNDYHAMLANYCNFGIIYNERKEFDKAMSYLRLAEETNEKFVNDELLRCYCVLYLGTVYFGQKKNEAALKCFLETIEIAKKNNFWLLFGEGALMAGQVYEALGEYEEAVKIFMTGVELTKAKNISRISINLYGVLRDFYKHRQDFEKALYYNQKFHTTRIEHLSVINEKNLERIKLLNHLEQAQKESDILRQKNLELGKINELLMETDKEKNDFLGVVVHDLKNPLTNIILIAGNLKKNIEKLLPEKKKTSLERIYLSSERMLGIIENLLDINKIESGDVMLNPVEINLKELFDEIITEFEVSSRKKNIKIILNNNLKENFFKTDKLLLKEILANLTSNAVKYSYKDSEIIINAFNDAGKTYIDVADKGLGIKDEEKSKVFQKFAKISNKPTAGENSTGLGLSIVKKLTELLGGGIEFESEYGKGSKFILTL